VQKQLNRPICRCGSDLLPKEPCIRLRSRSLVRRYNLGVSGPLKNIGSLCCGIRSKGDRSVLNNSILNNGITAPLLHADFNAHDWSMLRYIVPCEKSTQCDHAMRPFVKII